MKRSKIGLIVVASLILNTVFILQPAGVSQVEASFPGYNGTLLFESDKDGNYEIYTLDADGLNEVRLTNNSASDWGAQWSPDRSKIIFRSARDGNGEIYVMDADGSDQTRLTNAAGDDLRPQWSPDGSQIVFTSNRDGNGEIYVMDADGSDQTRLTTNGITDMYALWSPDGSKILYIAPQFGASAEIYTMNANGTGTIQLTTNGAQDNNARWSPDGSRVVFDRGSEIYVVNSDGTDETRLTNNSVANFGGLWSPDGQKLLYTQCNSGFTQCDMWQMDVDGDNQVKLFDAPAPGYPNIDASLSIFSPDGKMLIANTWDADWSDESSFLVNLDTLELTQLIDTPAGVNVPDWQPIPNTAPVLASKTSSVLSGASSLIDVLSGSTDEETLSGSNITIATPPSHGSAIVESGKIKYTADTDYAGADSLVYEVCDSFTLDQQCSTKTLNLTVKPSLGLAKIGTTQTTGSTKVETTNTKPTFSGTTTPLAQVTVEIHSDPVILTTQADSEGNWSVTPDEPLPAGDHTVYISSTLNGQTTELESFVLGVSQTIPNTGAAALPILVSGGLLLFLGLILYYYDRRYNWRRHMPPLFG